MDQFMIGSDGEYIFGMSDDDWYVIDGDLYRTDP